MDNTAGWRVKAPICSKSLTTVFFLKMETVLSEMPHQKLRTAAIKLESAKPDDKPYCIIIFFFFFFRVLTTTFTA